MTKYFFGYYLYHGKVNAICWPVIDGFTVGTHIEAVQAHEINEDEWSKLTISDLAAKYPYIQPPTLSPV